jgi:hypothetical protein
MARSSIRLFSLIGEVGFCLFSLVCNPRLILESTLYAKLGIRGIRTVFYIDDILILVSTYAICLENTMEALFS